MKFYFGLIIFLSLIGFASAETYSPNVTFSIQDFTGECDFEKVESLELSELAICFTNFFSPAVSLDVLWSPLSGDNLIKKIKAISSGTVDDDGSFNLVDVDVVGIPSAIVNTPVIFLYFILEMIFAGIKFVFVVIFRFIIVYVFWVSLGFQVVLNALNQRDRYESLDSIESSFILMLVASIYVLAVGGG